MKHPNPLEAYGYVAIAIASEIAPGQWRGSFTATKNQAATIRDTNVALHPTREEAEQAALAAARILAKGAGQRKLIRPTPEEDATITAAALSDPDSRPYTDAEWAKVKPRRGLSGPTGGGKLVDPVPAAGGDNEAAPGSKKSSVE